MSDGLRINIDEDLEAGEEAIDLLRKVCEWASRARPFENVNPNEMWTDDLKEWWEANK